MLGDFGYDHATEDMRDNGYGTLAQKFCMKKPNAGSQRGGILNGNHGTTIMKKVP
jgi:hypothetical protein